METRKTKNRHCSFIKWKVLFFDWWKSTPILIGSFY
jgi:hypothetical protein